MDADAQLTNVARAPRGTAMATQLLHTTPEFAPNLTRKGKGMLWTIFVILLVLWLLGLVTSYTLGGFLHILLVVALAIALIQLISGRRAV